MHTKPNPDLSPRGVDTILAELASAGLDVYYYDETDGDTFLDINLSDPHAHDAPVVVLSWRTTGGWELHIWDDGDTAAPVQKWQLGDLGPAAVARRVAAILADANAAEDADLTTATAVARALLAAGWKPDACTPMSSGRTEYAFAHPSGRRIAASVDWAGDEVELRLTGLTVDQAAAAIAGLGGAR